jgi:elongation factor Ts
VTIIAAAVKELREATGAGILDCKNALQAHGGDFEKAATYLREKGLIKAAQKVDRETEAGLVVVKAVDNNACVIEVNCETDFVARTDNFRTFVHRAADQVLADPGLTDSEGLLAANFIDMPGKTIADVVQELISKLDENIVVRRVAHYAGGSIVESYVHAGALEGFFDPMEGRIGVLVELIAGNAADNSALRDLAHDLVLHIASASPEYLSVNDIPDEVVESKRVEWVTQLARENKPEPIQARIVEGRLNSFYQDICLLRQAFVKDTTISVETLLQQKSAEIGEPVIISRFARFEIGA